MYHITDDVRARKSAALIVQGLEQCLQEKPFEKIRISDIHGKCYVSRTTFYRLFDSIQDVLLYEWDQIRDETMKAMEERNFASKREEILYFSKLWFSHELLLKTVIENRLYGVLSESHMRHSEELKKLYAAYYVNDEQFHCFIYLLTSMIFASIAYYLEEKDKKPIDEIMLSVCENATTIIDTWKAGLAK